MKKSSLSVALAAMLASGAVQAQSGLYYIGSEAQESLPLEWVVGVNAIWDDNVTPVIPAGPGANNEAFALNPYVGLSFVNIAPQQTLDVYARVGAVYYFDQPAALSDDFFEQLRIGVNWTRRLSERLRFSSRNFAAYELEPDYSFGFASARQIDPYFYWQTDNSVGYRWTERFATYTGLRLFGIDFDSAVRNQDRFVWSVYNQFRYQITPQTVLTADYRYQNVTGDALAADSSSHFLLAGVEHRFSPNTILVVRGGVQMFESAAPRGFDGTAPQLEVALRSQINERFSLRAFTRYSREIWDTVRLDPTFGQTDFDNRQTLRIGISGEYALSPMLNLFGGLDLIAADFDDGRQVPTNIPVGASRSENLWNAYIGLSVRFTDTIFGTLTYNYTDSDSDFQNFNFDRNRFSVGVRAEF